MSKKAKYDCHQCGKALPLSVLMDGQKLNCSACGMETNLLEALSKGAAGRVRKPTKKSKDPVKVEINGGQRVHYVSRSRRPGSQWGWMNL